MKKILKLIVAIILALAILGGIAFLIDCSSIKSGKKPILCKELNVYEDGGTKEYIGLGYKIIDFNLLNGFDDIKIGSWFMDYKDFDEEIKSYDKESNDNIEIKDDIGSGDVELNSGDVNPSGEQNNDGTNSGDIPKVEDVSGEQNLDVPNSGDGSTEKVEPSFVATIIGINSNTMVVSPLEDEAIRASSDMISFAITENQSNQNYMIGQKIRIKYNGEIRETYPAQIDALEIEIVE